MNDDLSLMGDLVARARAAGADAADAVLFGGTSLSVSRRGGVTEQLERSEDRDLGLRVFVGGRAATVSATDMDPAGFGRLAERAVAMARLVPPDPLGGLAERAAASADAMPDLDDGQEPSADVLIARAQAAEDAARSIPGVTNSEGAEAGFSRRSVTLVTSAGFAGRYTRSGHSVSATALAGAGTAMQRDYDYHGTVFLADLDAPEAIGHSAGHRAVHRLNPVRAQTAKLPVVFDPRVAGGLLGHLSGAVNGAAVARGTSFLKDRMGERVLPAGIDVLDDPGRPRGLRSKPFDGEGVPTAARTIVADGVLQSWFLDSRSARQLGLQSTGHAARGTGGPPSPSATNLWMTPGVLSPGALMEDIRLGLYVTELLGQGVNGLTGDYSRGAAGFMIRDGEIAEPVAEITIAGSLRDMFLNLTPANDLRFRRGTDAPTLRVEQMTLAGA